MIDLHTHSTFSDGTKTPEEIILIAKEKGLKAIALSDHDTVSGLESAKYFGNIHNIEIINAIEFSADFNGKEIHILGYFIDTENKELLNTIKQLEITRDIRNNELVEKLQSLNLNITMEDLKKLAPSSIITKAHFGRALVNKGYVKSIKEAFALYLGENKPAFVSKKLINYKDAINLISNSGGICVLAHPYIYGYSEKDLENNIKQLKNDGLTGIECYYSSHTKKQVNNLLNICKKYNLKISAGSDFHGDNRPEVSLGEIFLGQKIDYKILQDLKV
ncbi:MAG: PHP domain-containing protein [Eubacteriales bacterium]|nr:PHP domain-containing protein [Eubacteriales bacterium]